VSRRKISYRIVNFQIQPARISVPISEGFHAFWKVETAQKLNETILKLAIWPECTLQTYQKFDEDIKRYQIIVEYTQKAKPR
jgi:hypothetical protein